MKHRATDPVNIVLLVLMLFSCISHSNAQIAPEEEQEKPTFSTAIEELKVRSLSAKGKAIEQLVQFENPQTINILQALIDGKLFEIRASGKIVIAKKQVDQYAIELAESGDNIGVVESSSIKKIKINNRLRIKIRSIIAEMQLNSADANMRLQAVKTLSKSINPESLKILKILAKTEKDSGVLDTLQLVFALENLNSSDKIIRLKGIETLKQKTSLTAVNRLQAIIEKDSEGQFIEPDAEIRKHAKSALVKMQSRLQIYQVTETVFFGLSLGAVLVLAAIGLAITFGVMGVINMAHGEMMMLGAYTTYVMQQIMPNHIALSLILSIPAAFYGFWDSRDRD